MNNEELRKHCEMQIKRCDLQKDCNHLLEYQSILNLLDENKMLKDRLNDVEKTILAMVEQGYLDGLTEYYSTGYNSEFGVRAKILLEKCRGEYKSLDDIGGNE